MLIAGVAHKKATGWQQQNRFQLDWSGGRKHKLDADACERIMASLMASDHVPRPAKRVVRNGEHRLALALVSDAVAESFDPPGKKRDEARAWLRMDLPLLSAKTCFEALDFDYGAVMAKLERRWKGMEG